MDYTTPLIIIIIIIIIIILKYIVNLDDISFDFCMESHKPRQCTECAFHTSMSGVILFFSPISRKMLTGEYAIK